EAGSVDSPQAGEGRAATLEVSCLLVQEPVAQGLGHARAAVVGGGAAYARDDGRDAVPSHRLEQLTEAICRGPARIAPPWRAEGQAGGRCHLDDGGAPRVDEPVPRLDGVAQRT